MWIDWLCEIWDSSAVRYVAATRFGFVLAIIGQQLSTLIEHNRMRRTVREALALELAHDLSVLDEYMESFQGNLSGQKQSRPLATQQTAILERCLDPAVSQLLTSRERIQSAVAFNQCLVLAERMGRTRNKLNEAPSILLSESKYILNWILPVAGQTLINLLCEVLARQDRFAYSRTEWMQRQLLPLYESNAISSDRTWRTSTIPDGHWPDGFLIAWNHDDKERAPSRLLIVELRPPGESGHIHELQTGMSIFNPWRAIVSKLDRKLTIRRLKRSNGDPSAITHSARKLSDLSQPADSTNVRDKGSAIPGG